MEGSSINIVILSITANSDENTKENKKSYEIDTQNELSYEKLILRVRVHTGQLKLNFTAIKSRIKKNDCLIKIIQLISI